MSPLAKLDTGLTGRQVYQWRILKKTGKREIAATIEPEVEQRQEDFEGTDGWD